jgi:hypothetical protein
LFAKKNLGGFDLLATPNVLSMIVLLCLQKQYYILTPVPVHIC